MIRGKKADEGESSVLIYIIIIIIVITFLVVASFAVNWALSPFK